jgi:hypothetical protein
VQDGDLVWLDSGLSAPSVTAASNQGGAQGGSGGTGGVSGGGKPQQWLPKSHYMVGDIIVDSYNGHYYTMVSSKGGTSGSAKEPFAPLPVTNTLHDGDFLWSKTNDPLTNGAWKPNVHYQIENVVTIDSGTYKAISTTATSGNSGNKFPTKENAGRLEDNDIIWQHLGKDVSNTQAWNKNTSYSFGQEVSFLGELYVVVLARGGNSGPKQPETPSGASGRPTMVSDNDLLWIVTGNSCTGPRWAPNWSYELDAKVCSSDHHLYQMVRYVAGTSGPVPQSPFPAANPSNQHPYPRQVTDGSVTWVAYGLPQQLGIWEVGTL